MKLTNLLFLTVLIANLSVKSMEIDVNNDLEIINQENERVFPTLQELVANQFLNSCFIPKTEKERKTKIQEILGETSESHQDILKASALKLIKKLSEKDISLNFLYQNRKPNTQFQYNHKFELCPRGEFIFVFGYLCNQELWNLKTKKNIATNEHKNIKNSQENSIQQAKFSPCSKYLAILFEYGNSSVFDTSTGDEILCTDKFKSISESNTCYSGKCDFSFTQDSKNVLINRYNRKEVLLLDLKGALINSYKTNQPNARISQNSNFSPDNKIIAFTTWVKNSQEDKENDDYWQLLELQHSKTHKIIKEVNFGKTSVENLIFSPCGKYLAISIFKETLLFNGQTGDIINYFEQENDYCSSLQFSPCSTYILTTYWSPPLGSSGWSAERVYDHSCKINLFNILTGKMIKICSTNPSDIPHYYHSRFDKFGNILLFGVIRSKSVHSLKRIPIKEELLKDESLENLVRYINELKDTDSNIPDDKIKQEL